MAFTSNNNTSLIRYAAHRKYKNKCDLFLYFSRFALPLQQLSAYLFIVVYFHI